MPTNSTTPELLSDQQVAAHKVHLDDDLEKIAAFGVSIESYPWLVRERDLHNHIAALRDQLAEAQQRILELETDIDTKRGYL